MILQLENQCFGTLVFIPSLDEIVMKFDHHSEDYQPLRFDFRTQRTTEVRGQCL